MDKQVFSYNQGTTICTQGEEALCFYILRKGKIEIIYNLDEVKPTPQEVCQRGKIVTVEKEEGCIIGEAGLFLGYRTASIRAGMIATELEHIPVNESGIEALIKSNPKIGLTLCRSLAGRIKNLSTQIREASFANMNINGSYNSLCLAFFNLIAKMEKSSSSSQLSKIIASAKEQDLYKIACQLKKERSNAMTVFHQALSKKRAGNITLPKGTELCRVGDIGRALYFINKGEIDVRIGGQNVARIRSGEIVGEIAVLLKETPQRTASLKAREDCVITTISVLDFNNTVMEHPNILVSLGFTMARRIHSTNRMIVDLESALTREINLLSGNSSSCEYVFNKMYEFLPNDNEEMKNLKDFAKSSAVRAAKTAKEMRENYQGILQRND